MQQGVLLFYLTNPKEEINMSNKPKSEAVEPQNVTPSTKKAGSKKPKDKEVKEPENIFEVLFKGKANKISTKSNGHIGFEFLRDKAGDLFIRLTSNTSGGIFSKNPISFKAVTDNLDKQEADKAFKSSLMKNVFEGKGSKSSNNTSFLIAVLRTKEFKLLQPSIKSSYLSQLSNDYHINVDRLRNL